MREGVEEGAERRQRQGERVGLSGAREGAGEDGERSERGGAGWRRTEGGSWQEMREGDDALRSMVPMEVTMRTRTSMSSMLPYAVFFIPEARVAIHPPSDENSNESCSPRATSAPHCLLDVVGLSRCRTACPVR